MVFNRAQIAKKVNGGQTVRSGVGGVMVMGSSCRCGVFQGPGINGPVDTRTQ